MEFPPLTPSLARRMLSRTKIFRALCGYRGKKPVDIDALEKILVRFSQLVLDLHLLIKEIDINPLLASSDGIIALDARVVIYPIEKQVEEIPEPAIRPYPDQYISSSKIDKRITFRPIGALDQRPLLEFFESYSQQLLEMANEDIEKKKIVQEFIDKIFNTSTQKEESDKKKFIHDIAVRLCMGDFDNQMSLIAIEKDKVLGLITYTRSIREHTKAYISMIFGNKMNLEVRKELLQKMISIAKSEGLKTLQGDFESKDENTIELCKACDFMIEENREEMTITATLHL